MGLDVLEVYALSEKQARVRLPQVVKPHLGELRGFECGQEMRVVGSYRCFTL